MPKTKSTEDLLQEQAIQIQELKDQLAALTKRISHVPPPGPKFPMWMIIRDYLREHGGSAEPKHIAEALTRSGHNLGRYPLRNVKITVVSPALQGIFRLTKDASGVETVKAIGGVLQFSPKKTPKR